MTATSSRSVRIWTWITLLLLVGVLALVVIAPVVQDPQVRGVYPAVGFASLVVIAAAIAVIWAIRPVRLTVADWTAWLAAGVTLALVLGPIALWYLGRDGLGYQVFQALGVGTSPYGFGDMEVVLSWLDCPRAGIDPYGADVLLCADAPANYGPAIFWLAPTGITKAAAPVLGIVGVALSALAIFWLVRQSSGWGRITLLVASVSAGWILLQERANLDAAIVWAAVFLVWLVRRYHGLWPWIVAAVPIWILGAWKYYPFAMVLALLPALRLKRGWMVIAGFLVSALAYLVIMRENVALSLESNANLSGGGFAGFGKDIAAAFVAGEAQSASTWGWGDVVIAVLMVSAAAWGWFVVGQPSSRGGRGLLGQTPLTVESMLAIGGSTAVLVAVGWSGFGYNYKAALLILGVPLLARLAARSDSASFRAGLFMLVLVLLAGLVTTNVLLSSVAVLVSGAFITGAALRPLLQWLPISRGSRNHSSAASPSA